LILAELLLIFSSSLLHGCEFLLQLTILRDGDNTGRKHYRTDNYHPFTDYNSRAPESGHSVRDCNSTIHGNPP
jgi:hypothetical protein